jgi:hypothetical protein
VQGHALLPELDEHVVHPGPPQQFRCLLGFWWLADGLPGLVVTEISQLRQELHLLAGEVGGVDGYLRGVKGVAASNFPSFPSATRPDFSQAGVP